MKEEIQPEAFSIIIDLVSDAKLAKNQNELNAILDDIRAVARYGFDVINYKGRKKPFA